MLSARLMLTIDSLMKRRFPTILGLGILVLGVIGGVLLVGQGTGGFLPRASAEFTPQQVRITNITENGFSVSFTTQQAASGAVKFGTEPNTLRQEVQDDRDQLNGQSGAYQTHHITVKGLQPQTQYYFQIVTQGRQVFENNGEPFSLRTARTAQPAAARSAYGSVLNQAGNPATGALMYFTTSGGSPLSAFVKTDGSWSIPLAQLRTQDLSTIFPVLDTTSMNIQVVGNTPADVLNFSRPVSQLSPLETLQFGAEVPTVADTPAGGAAADSTDQELLDELAQLDDELLSDEDLLNDIDGTGGFNDLVTDEDRFSTQQITNVTIVFPSEEAETVNTTRPELSGKAPPRAVLQIEVHSETPYYGVVESDAQGNWNWTPPADLEEGEHTITVTYTDDSGTQQRMTRNFLVQADTNLPAFQSTPSGQIASPVPSPLPSPIPSPVPSPRPSPLPSPIASPTPVATSSATLPVSGSTLPLVVFGAGAAALLGMGNYARRWIPERRR